MQTYLISTKNIKQSVANAKTFLSEKGLKVPSAVVCEMVSKMFFKKTYNDLIAQCRQPAILDFNISELFLSFSQEVSLSELKQFCNQVAIKVDFDNKSFLEFEAIDTCTFKITVDNLKSPKNGLAFLMSFQLECVDKGWTLLDFKRSSFRVETENLLMTNISVENVSSELADNGEKFLGYLKRNFNEKYQGGLERINFCDYEEGGCFDLWTGTPELAPEVYCLYFNLISKETSAEEFDKITSQRLEGHLLDIEFFKSVKRRFQSVFEESNSLFLKDFISKKAKINKLFKDGSEICTIWTKEGGWKI